jgi:hypothetical protein
VKKRDRKALGRYCRELADRLELRDWTINIEHAELGNAGTDGERTLADVDTTTGRKLVQVRVCSDFRAFDREKQRHVLVHELVHVHLAALQEQCEYDVADLIGKPADAVFCRSFRRNLEYAVDALASALAKHQPLIDWPE